MIPFLDLYCLRQFLIASAFAFWIATCEDSSHTKCSPDKKNEILCQEARLTINCTTENGDGEIYFVKANFGRNGRNHCKQFFGIEISDCDYSTETLKILNDLCGNKPNCDLLVTKDVFGSPCFAITKYLDVTYYCLPHYCKDTPERFTIPGTMYLEANGREIKLTTKIRTAETKSDTRIINNDSVWIKVLGIRQLFMVAGTVIGLAVLISLIIIVSVSVHYIRRCYSHRKAQQHIIGSGGHQSIALLERQNESSGYASQHEYHEITTNASRIYTLDNPYEDAEYVQEPLPCPTELTIQNDNNRQADLNENGDDQSEPVYFVIEKTAENN